MFALLSLIFSFSSVLAAEMPVCRLERSGHVVTIEKSAEARSSAVLRVYEGDILRLARTVVQIASHLGTAYTRFGGPRIWLDEHMSGVGQSFSSEELGLADRCAQSEGT